MILWRLNLLWLWPDVLFLLSKTLIWIVVFVMSLFVNFVVIVIGRVSKRVNCQLPTFRCGVSACSLCHAKT